MVEIVLDGPAKNCLGSAMIASITERALAANGAPLLVRGTGDVFSAGLDLREVAGLDAAGMVRFLEALEEMARVLFEYPGPTVALVDGHAIAGGCIVALCCDHRVGRAGGSGRIGLNEVALGLQFPPGILQIVRARVPQQHLDRVLLGAELFSPDEAAAFGLLDELCDDPEDAARRRIALLASRPADAYAACKRALRGSVEVSDAIRTRFLDQVVPTWTSPELRQRILRVLTRD